MVDASAWLRAIRAALPAELQQAITNVRFELRDAPTAVDVARGATADHVAYYFGDSRERLEETALPDESSPVGVIVVFVSKVQPWNVDRFCEVVCHEILHVLGYEEHVIVHEFGLAP